jgi:threonine synthase
MKYYSLNRTAAPVDFRTATLQGQAPDRGLYFPESIPQWRPGFLQEAGQMSAADMGTEVMAPYVAGSIPEDILHRIVEETLSFPVPLVRITEDISSLELFHGPTLAFKDVGARFMSRCLGYFAGKDMGRVVVLVATSGDTGGAVAHGFHHVPGVDVVILYPSGKVSPVQEKQLTALGGNIHALEVQGTFDDCQRMVKDAFADKALTDQLFLTSANSINVARWLPQQLYYILAWTQWQQVQPPVIAVPSGNFGNICAGLLAWRSGLPIGKFVAACNVNDVVPRFLLSGGYQPEPAKATLSNAMDVGDPSNFVRILELFSKQTPALREIMEACSISDAETEQTIDRVFQAYGYTLDPHGAVGFLALERHLAAHPGAKGFFLETAHPLKFPDSVERITGKTIDVPPQVEDLLSGSKQALIMPPSYHNLRDYLMAFYRGR